MVGEGGAGWPVRAPIGDPGVAFAREGVLVERALGLLAGGPLDSRELAARALGLSGGPAHVAERVLRELFREHPDVSRGPDDLWRVTSQPESEKALAGLRFAVVDVETTGGMAGRSGRIIELAIVHVERGAIIDSFATLLDAGVAVPPWITRLTGIRTEMIRGAPRFGEIADEVRSRLRGRVFVAHSVGYDWGFLQGEMRRIGAAPPRGPRLCTVHLARRLLPGLERRGLDALARYYGVEIRDRHRAQGDAIATAQVLIRMLADAERRGWTTWAGLRRALAPSKPVADEAGRVGPGTHAGR